MRFAEAPSGFNTKSASNKKAGASQSSSKASGEEAGDDGTPTWGEPTPAWDIQPSELNPVGGASPILPP